MSDPGQSHRMIPPCHGLPDKTGSHKIQPCAAEFFRHSDPKEAVIADLWKGVFRPPFILIHTFAQGIKLIAGKTIRIVEDHLLFRIQIEAVGPFIRSMAILHFHSSRLTGAQSKMRLNEITSS